MDKEKFTYADMNKLANATKFIVAGIIYGADNRENEEEKIEDGILHWSALAESVDKDERWSDGRHSGDCTKEAHTCNRCLYTEYLNRAEYLLDMATDGLLTQIQEMNNADRV